jgi:hypothetical protein
VFQSSTHFKNYLIIQGKAPEVLHSAASPANIRQVTDKKKFITFVTVVQLFGAASFGRTSFNRPTFGQQMRFVDQSTVDEMIARLGQMPFGHVILD